MTYRVQRPVPEGFIPLSDKIEKQLDEEYFAEAPIPISETQAKAIAFDMLLKQMSEAANAPLGRWQNSDAEKAYVNGLKHWVSVGHRMVMRQMNGLDVE